ncbi:MAG TPA: trehalose-phosphatase [Streptosporangiaceae bacterium]|nr:trehalose-phosphatase [Streptosporangiaceae bacterium]
MTPEGEAGLDAIVASPKDALVGLDFDGTLAPIVPDPRAVRAHPDAVPALTRLAGLVGTVAIITGRPAADAVGYGGLDAVPSLIVLGHYGWQRWQDGQLSTPEPPPGVDLARDRLPALIKSAGPAAEGTWIEDKAHALAVHTRRAVDPDGALERLRGPLTTLAAELDLAAEPGRLVVELRPHGVDKGAALRGLVRETTARSVLYGGDDLGDLAAFDAVRELRADGIAGCVIASASPEAPRVAAAADLVVAGPAGIVRFLDWLADQISAQGGELLG